VTGYCRRWHDAILQLEGGKDVRCDSSAHDPNYERILRQTWRFNRRSAELTVEGLLAQIAKTRVTPRSRGLFFKQVN
jgi:hypothetical protein